MITDTKSSSVSFIKAENWLRNLVCVENIWVNNASEKKNCFSHRPAVTQYITRPLSVPNNKKKPCFPKWNIRTYSIAQISWDWIILVMVMSHDTDKNVVCNVCWEWSMWMIDMFVKWETKVISVDSKHPSVQQKTESAVLCTHQWGSVMNVHI